MGEYLSDHPGVFDPGNNLNVATTFAKFISLLEGPDCHVMGW